MSTQGAKSTVTEIKAAARAKYPQTSEHLLLAYALGWTLTEQGGIASSLASLIADDAQDWFIAGGNDYLDSAPFGGLTESQKGETIWLYDSRGNARN
jgi:hypothetical protein